MAPMAKRMMLLAYMVVLCGIERNLKSVKGGKRVSANECKSWKDVRDNESVGGSRSGLKPFFSGTLGEPVIGFVESNYCRYTEYSTEIAQLIHPLNTHLGTLT